MLIVPLHQPLTRETFPWVTLALVLINVLVYFGFQLGDETRRERALDFYAQSPLGALELPKWRAQLEPKRVAELEAMLGPLDTPSAELEAVKVELMQDDAAFLDALRNGEVIERRHPKFQEWRAARAQFDPLWAQQFTPNWVARYHEIDPVTMLSSTFLHGDFGHLFGNMLFLMVLGLLVEGALGGSVYLLLYLAAGIGASAASLAYRFGDPGSGLGASGAIAGLMGAYAVLYGLRKVRVFYWFFVVMDYVRLPALALLPVWLGWELAQLAFDDSSNVAFDAHAGGLLSGALLAVLVLACKLERRAFIDGASDSAQAPQARLNEALGHLGRLELAKAAAILSPLAESHPLDPSIQLAHYRLRRLSAPHAAPHELAYHVLIELPWKMTQAADYERITEDYLKASHGRPKLKPEALSAIGQRLALYNRFATSEKIAQLLIQDPTHREKGLELLLKLAERRIAQQDPDGARSLLKELAKHAEPSSPALARARGLLKDHGAA
jgi:membrane associated rhomboid family serine protease